MTTKFFKFPFGVSGDKTAIPDALQVDGSVSYTEGWTFDYQRDPTTDPAAKEIPRDKSNQLMFDVTNALNQYQTFGFPDFITTSDNGGTPYSYSKYATVRYDDGTNGPRIYQSTADTNTALPTDDTKWDWLDFKTTSNAIVLEDAVFEGTVADKDVVYWNTSTNQFTKAIANGTSTQNAVGIADVTNKRVYFSGEVSILTGLTPGAIYYLSSSVAGGITTVLPATNIIRLGVAKSTTELFLLPIFQSGFGVSLATTGFTLLPNGLIVQWGQGVAPTGTANPSVNVVFPLTFPNQLFHVFTSYDNLPNPGTVGMQLTAPSPSRTLSGCNLIGLVNSNVSNVMNMEYLAIGY